MAYVALSRLTSLQGFALEALDTSKLYADDEALVEYERLRNKSSRRGGKD